MLIPFEKSFASHEKSKFWNYEKNGDIYPKDVFMKTGKSYWFQCDKCCHEFCNKLSNISNGNWCPYCANKQFCGNLECTSCFEKSFASHEKSKFWNYEKNGNIKPIQVAKYSNKKYWFKCDKCFHTYDITLNTSNKCGCPYCAVPTKRLCENVECVSCFEKSFASHEKSKFWNYEKNGNIKPVQVTISSGKKYWFDCIVCNHIFHMEIRVINRGGWCHYCSGHKICGNNECKICFDKSFASCDKSKFWDYEKNGDIKPIQVTKCSGEKYWFKCVYNHEFSIKLHYISRDQWCPYCAVPTKRLCENVECVSCFEKSFASHIFAVNWNKEKNGDITPRNICKGTSKEYYFDCKECEHTYEMPVSCITTNNVGCPYCNGNRLCNDNECNWCHERSFASHEKAKYWNNENNGDIKPRDIVKGTQTKYWFNCDSSHNHPSFEISPSKMSRGDWCHLCGNLKKAEYRRKTTEQFVEEAKQKHGDKYDYSKVDYNNTHENVVIVCKSHGEFQQTPSSHLRGAGCPMCVNKTEGKLYETMKQIYPMLTRQFKQDWCKRTLHLPFDFCIPEYKIIIELDGAQHFRQIRDWSSPEEQFENDKYKEECANQNGYSVIRLLQEDVFYDTYDWVKELCEAIEEVKSSEGITNVYLCKNGEYDQF